MKGTTDENVQHYSGQQTQHQHPAGENSCNSRRSLDSQRMKTERNYSEISQCRELLTWEQLKTLWNTVSGKFLIIWDTMLFWPNKTCWDVSVASGNCEKMCKNLSSVIVNLIIGTDWTIDDIISTKCQPEESNLTRRTYFVTIFEPQMSNFLLFAAISPLYIWCSSPSFDNKSLAPRS